MHPYNKNEWHKNSAGVVDSDGSFPRHIWNSHREYFVAPTSVDLIVVALHNTAFHFAIKQLPLTAQAQLITSVQACLDHCSIDIDLAAARLQYLIDLCLSSGLLPTPCWIDKVIATKYQLITGGGDFSVYSGRHAGRAVAIRHRHGSLRGRGRPRLQLIQSFASEVVIHWQLQHPNIAPLLGIQHFDGTSIPAMILQYDGCSLAIDYLRTHALPHDFLRIVIGMFEAIYYLHTMSPLIIHGIIQDGSILVNSSGDALLWDFGFSRISGGPVRGDQRHQRPDTFQLPYIAPELLDAGTSATTQSDMYSLAMTIWSLGKSQPSWGFPDHFVGASAMLQRGRPPVPFDVPGALTDDGTSPLWESIGRMFCHDPRDRPTISNIRNELIHGGLLPLPPSKAWGSLCLPQHLYVHHFEYLTRISRASMRSVRRALDNTRLFRSTLLLLPRIELAHVAEALQMCINLCSVGGDAKSEGFKLLQDICSFSGQPPNSYRLDHVSKGRRISRGGEATVYRGTYRNHDVVIRELHSIETGESNESEQWELVKLFTREVISHWQLRHPNIVALIGIYKFDDEPLPSMVLQYAQHSSARNFLKLHPSPRGYLKIVIGIVEGIYYLHTRSPPVVHGDLHDDNVLVTISGDALLCDFGLSRIKHMIARTHTIVRQGGRPRFIAPEIYNAEDDLFTHEPADIYSLAMTIYALGIGSVPFEELKNERAASAAARRGERPSNRDSLCGLAAGDTKLLWSLITKMWDHEPQRRPTASIVRDEISQSGLIS